jgi:hypothetical protein
MIGAGGLAVSVVVFTVGAILDFAVTTTTERGVNIQTVGVILMIASAVGAMLSLILLLTTNAGWRRHRTVIDDGRGHVARREDTYT